MNARDEFVGSAKQEADSIRRSAEEQARQMLEGQSVYLAAQKKAEETVRGAEEKSRELRRVAGAYLDDALRTTEEAIASALEEVRNARSQFKAVTAVEPSGHSDVTLEDVEGIDLLGQ